MDSGSSNRINNTNNIQNLPVNQQQDEANADEALPRRGVGQAKRVEGGKEATGRPSTSLTRYFANTAITQMQGYNQQIRESIFANVAGKTPEQAVKMLQSPTVQQGLMSNNFDKNEDELPLDDMAFADVIDDEFSVLSDATKKQLAAAMNRMFRPV